VRGQQRDGSAWFTEWLTSPQLCLSTGRALSLAADVAAPHHAAMARALAQDGGVIHAAPLTFTLARILPRTEASAAITALVAEALAQRRDLTAVALAGAGRRLVARHRPRTRPALLRLPQGREGVRPPHP
jgi:3-carboxy-cis,cis-muconate cycloisomerase